MTDLDTAKENEDVVTLMTLHAAKGLEFPVVFITGLEEGIFPAGARHHGGHEKDIEEERRLCYVGITRAREELYCTVADSRTLFGSTNYNTPSRFLRDIPDELMQNVEGSLIEPEKKWSWEDVDITHSPAAEAILKETIQRESSGFRTGDRVRHATFGVGIVLATQGSGEQAKVTVNFPKLGIKTIALAYAALEKL